MVQVRHPGFDRDGDRAGKDDLGVVDASQDQDGGIGLPEELSTVTVIVSSPRAKPVVSRLPRSTVLKVLSTFRVVATGVDVNSGVPLESVTVKKTVACCCAMRSTSTPTRTAGAAARR